MRSREEIEKESALGDLDHLRRMGDADRKLILEVVLDTRDMVERSIANSWSDPPSRRTMMAAGRPEMDPGLPPMPPKFVHPAMTDTPLSDTTEEM